MERQYVEIGAKVRQKSGVGPLMTVKALTAQGYVVCKWLDPDTGRPQERMFFAEMLQEHAPPAATQDEQ